MKKIIKSEREILVVDEIDVIVRERHQRGRCNKRRYGDSAYRT